MYIYIYILKGKIKEFKNILKIKQINFYERKINSHVFQKKKNVGWKIVHKKSSHTLICINILN